MISLERFGTTRLILSSNWANNPDAHDLILDFFTAMRAMRSLNPRLHPFLCVLYWDDLNKMPDLFTPRSITMSLAL